VCVCVCVCLCAALLAWIIWCKEKSLAPAYYRTPISLGLSASSLVIILSYAGFFHLRQSHICDIIKLGILPHSVLVLRLILGMNCDHVTVRH